MNKKRILFVIDSLGIGGAEKSLVTLLNLLDYSRYEVDLQLFTYGGIFEKFISKEVHVLPALDYDVFLKKSILQQFLYTKKLWARLHYSFLIRKPNLNHSDRARIYWNTIGECISISNKTYDVAIGYGQNVPTFYVIDKVHAAKKCVWVNCIFHLEGENKRYQQRFFNVANEIAIVSEDAYKHFTGVYPEFVNKMSVILDLYDASMIKRMSELPSDKPIIKDVPVIMTAGRLNKPQKGYDLALEAAKILRDRGLNFRWYAIGDGPYRGEMERFIEDNQLQDYFILLGFTANPYSYMHQCDIYVQTSRHEGFGLTIAEARILNRPVVCTNFEACTMQMIDGKNGLITSFEPNDIADAIERLMKDKQLYMDVQNYLKTEKKGNVEEITKFYQLIED